jgi:2C-methyl-D-erythritol 2,4-cyclodiphosphate synthase
MNLVKSQLTFTEVYSTVRDIADSCFTKDEEGNDIDYSPAAKSASIQVAFVENYTDFVFLKPSNPDDEKETSEVFDKNYAEYMAIDIDDFIEHSYNPMFNIKQWNSILESANELIEYRKQKLLQKNDTISNLVADLIKEQLETVKLQKKVIEQTEKLNSQYTKKDIDKMLKLLDRTNKNFNSKDYIMGVAEAVHNDKNIIPMVNETKGE